MKVLTILLLSSIKSGLLLDYGIQKQYLYPYQVFLHLKNGAHFCDGAILNKNSVITSAKCVEGLSPSCVLIQDGSKHFHKTAQIHQHDKFDITQNYNDNDVAILKLATPLKFSNKVQPIEYQFKDTLLNPGTKAQYVNINPKEMTILQKVNVSLISNKNCQDYFDQMDLEITENMLCGDEIGRDSCIKNIGGPLVYEDVIIGIVSFNLCPFFGYPSLFTSIAAVYDFIDKYM